MSMRRRWRRCRREYLRETSALALAPGERDGWTPPAKSCAARRPPHPERGWRACWWVEISHNREGAGSQLPHGNSRSPDRDRYSQYGKGRAMVLSVFLLKSMNRLGRNCPVGARSRFSASRPANRACVTQRFTAKHPSTGNSPNSRGPATAVKARCVSVASAHQTQAIES